MDEGMEQNYLPSVPAHSTNNRAIVSPGVAMNTTMERRLERSPTPVSLQGVIHDDWQLRLPLILFVDREEDGWYVISDDEFFVYGDGATYREAIEAYIASLIEYYGFLAREYVTNASAAPQWDTVRRYLQPTVTGQ